MPFEAFPDAKAPIDLGGAVDCSQIAAVAGGAPVAISRAARAVMQRSAEILESLAADRRRVYGVTTGYGPLAGQYVAPAMSETLQRNLIYHLASGVGRPLPERQVRAVMAARLASLARGHSGVGATVVDALLALLGRRITPYVPEMGTVGASGDLTPLAHVALTLLGEGAAFVEGREMPAKKALAAADLTPVKLGRKDGLALVNGTSAMTGIAALNGADAARLLRTALRLAAGAADVLGARMEAYDAFLAAARPHPGQAWAASALRKALGGSRRVVSPELPNPLLPEGEAVMADQTVPQDPYTLRCIPQELGAAWDVLAFHDRIVTTELNAASDNPLVDIERGCAVHGGNFYGQHVAFASDALMPAVIKLAVHAERLVNRLTDPVRNQGLPAFLTGGTVGLSSGLMGAQVTATALVAEMRSLAVPASIQSIPTNADNQDVVTLGTVAARKVAHLIGLLSRVLAIEALAVANAVTLLRRDDDGGFAPATLALAERIHALSPPLDADRPLGREIEALAAAIVKDGLA